MPGRPRDLQNVEPSAMDDPRLTPARPDLAAKYLEGKVEAERFVSGEDFEMSDAIVPLRRGPSPTQRSMTEALKGERVTVYDRNGEGWAWGQLDARRLCRLASRSCAGASRRRADAQGHGAPDICVSRPFDQTAAARDAGDGVTLTVMREDGAFRRDARGLVSAAAHLGPLDRIRARFRRRSPNGSSARLISGAARPASESIVPAWCRSR